MSLAQGGGRAYHRSMAGIGTVLSVFSGWRGKLLMLAGILALAGFGLNSAGVAEPEPEKGARPGISPSLRTDLAGPQESPRKSLAEAARSSTWGDAAIRIGLSFGVAMIFASLLRAFLKTMLSFAVAAFLVCWFLHYRGWIEPFWEEFEFSLEHAQTWVAGQFETVKGFLGGLLPSTGAAIAGFLFGLRK